MSRPPKPYVVLKNEKKSHRTKAELKQRKDGEEALLTGVALKERQEIKENPVAHKEFLRIRKLLKEIGKNDDIYGPVINRYCMIQAECIMFNERREELYKLIHELKKEYDEVTKNMDPDEREFFLLEYSRSMAKLSTTMINLDKQIQTKRRMLFDIEKENIMTISAALRNIPKEVKTEENPLLKALRD